MRKAFSAAIPNSTADKRQKIQRTSFGPVILGRSEAETRRLCWVVKIYVGFLVQGRSAASMALRAISR